MYLVLLQTQSTAGAALEIIVMLLGAALIGVLTTYFFMKSKYDKIISSLQSELEASEKARAQLNSDLSAVKQELSKKEGEFEKLNLKFEELKKKEENSKKDTSRGRTAGKKEEGE